MKDFTFKLPGKPATPVLLLIGIVLTACNDASRTTTGPFTGAGEVPQVVAAQHISTAKFHESPNDLSEDGQTFYFTRSDREFRTSTLYRSHFLDGKWTPPERLPFSGEHYDADLTLSPSENRAYFTSKRPPEREGLSPAWNIWQVDHLDSKWGTPSVLQAPINSDSMECCLVMNKSGQTYFSSNRAGTWDIYSTEFDGNRFGNVQRMEPPVNTPRGEWPGYVDHEDQLLLFSSIRKTGVGGDDLYKAERTKSGERRVVLLDTVINSPAYEDHPLYTPDGQYLIFSSWRGTPWSNGVSNIYVVKKKSGT